MTYQCFNEESEQNTKSSKLNEHLTMPIDNDGSRPIIQCSQCYSPSPLKCTCAPHLPNSYPKSINVNMMSCHPYSYNKNSNPSRLFQGCRIFPTGMGGRNALRTLCFITSCAAFLTGIVVGLFIPLYVVPPTSVFQTLKSSSHLTSSALSQPSVIYNEPSSSVYSFSTNLQLSSISPPSPSYPYPKYSKQSSDFISKYNRDKFHVIKSSSANNRISYSNSKKYLSESEKSKSQDSIKSPSSISSAMELSGPDSRIWSLHPVHSLMPEKDEYVLKAQNSETRQPKASGNPSTQVSTVKNPFVDGIYWTQTVEENIPKGFDENDFSSWKSFVNHSKVNDIQDGCGRMQNRLITFEGGTQACCRYRQNFDQIQGEIFSFYLSRILKLKNLAPSSLDNILPSDSKWESVTQKLSAAKWSERKPIVLTKFLKNLSPAYIPKKLRDPNHKRLYPIDILESVNSIDSNEWDLSELAQWSDLIVFDYLTANLDRVVNNLYNLQWNPSMMEAPAHNLAKSDTGLLIFLDNESGLLHGYRLLDKYEQYHRTMLDSLCVFRKSTADAIRSLHKNQNVGRLLKTMFQTLDQDLLDYLPMIPEKSIKILNTRISRVYDQINHCESLFPSS